MPTLATLMKILSTSIWAHFKSFGYFIEKNRKQVFSGHCLGSTKSQCHYINELDLILVTDESLLKASFGHDGVIRVLLCEFLLMLQNYKEARFLSKK